MTYWSISECYNRYVNKLLVSFWRIKDIYLSRSIYVNNNDVLSPLSYMNRIHVSFHLGLLSIIIISHIRYASNIIIIVVHLVIFNNGVWIVLGSKTINENLISPLRCHHATTSNKGAMIVASSLWTTFADKRRGDTVSRQCWSGTSRFPIGLLISWIPGKIGIPHHCPFSYTIIF